MFYRYPAQPGRRRSGLQVWIPKLRRMKKTPSRRRFHDRTDHEFCPFFPWAVFLGFLHHFSMPTIGPKMIGPWLRPQRLLVPHQCPARRPQAKCCQRPCWNVRWLGRAKKCKKYSLGHLVYHSYSSDFISII